MGAGPELQGHCGEARGPPAQTSAALAPGPSSGVQQGQAHPEKDSAALQVGSEGLRILSSVVPGSGCGPAEKVRGLGRPSRSSPWPCMAGAPPVPQGGPAPSVLAPCPRAPLSPSCGLSTRELPRASPHPDHRMSSCGSCWESRPAETGWGRLAAQKALLQRRWRGRGWWAGDTPGPASFTPARGRWPEASAHPPGTRSSAGPPAGRGFPPLPALVVFRTPCRPEGPDGSPLLSVPSRGEGCRDGRICPS